MLNILIFFSGFTLILQNFRIGGVNITPHDLIVLMIGFIFLVSKNGIIRQKNTYWLLVAALTTFGAITVNAALYKSDAFLHLAQIIYVFLIYIPILSSVIIRTTLRKYFITGIIISFALIIFQSIVELVTGSDEYIGGRYVGHMKDPQFTAFIIALTAPVLLYSINKNHLNSQSRKLLNIFYLTLYIGLFWILIRTASKSGLLAFFASNAFYIAYSFKDNLFNIKGIRLAVLLFFIIFGLYYFIDIEKIEFHQKILERFETLNEQESIIGGRSDLITNAITLFEWKNIFLGYGFENVQYYSASQMKPHNIFILYLLEGGLFFVSIYAALILFFLKEAYHSLKITIRLKTLNDLIKSEQMILITGVSILIAYLVISFFNTPSILRPIWIGAIIITAANYNINRQYKK